MVICIVRACLFFENTDILAGVYLPCLVMDIVSFRFSYIWLIEITGDSDRGLIVAVLIFHYLRSTWKEW